jgi:hypothetical protein
VVFRKEDDWWMADGRLAKQNMKYEHGDGDDEANETGEEA